MAQQPGKVGLYDPAYEHDSCGVGLIAHIRGLASRALVDDALRMLCRMDHRGAVGSEPNTGDGAGILTSLPREFLIRRVADEWGLTGLDERRLAAGNFFLPREASAQGHCQTVISDLVQARGLRVVGWRSLPVDFDAADVGPSARQSAPAFAQLIIAADPDLDAEELERHLYVIRKRATKQLRQPSVDGRDDPFYCCSLSGRTLVYKGMLRPGQLATFYGDLADPDFHSPLAIVHSRFSTNTFPSWSRAQPNRWMSHNGEINTLRGNKNWMRAREGLVRSARFGADLAQVCPVIESASSDSGTFDNVLEFLVLGGRSLPEAMMMMIPEAWQKHPAMSPATRAFYEYHACIMEPWDGPASITFTDGRVIGAVLDRNGLRPSRYYVTHDDRVILASEVGVLDIPPEQIRHKGRLQAGWMLLIDCEQGRIVPDAEIKEHCASQRPYATWLQRTPIRLADLRPHDEPHGYYPETLLPRMQAFGYTVETGHFLLFPLIREKRDPVGSMGNDAALACLSDQPRLLYDYFRQLFAQVTNPPIDSIREERVMSLECYIGPEGNLLDPCETDCRRLLVPHPILTNEELMALRNVNFRGWRCRTIDITFERQDGTAGLVAALDRICAEAEQAIEDGNSLIVLTDRATNRDRVPVSSLLACGAVHHHLVRQALRTRLGIVLETGEAREVHHHCLLIGYGADAINPYLAFEALWRARRQGLVTDDEFPDDDKIVATYRQGVAKGILKVMAKMGISTLQSYKGAQIFEAVGLHEEVVSRCFHGTPSRLQGVGFEILAEESFRRHERGYPRLPEDRFHVLPNTGEFHWRPDGEKHAWDPTAISQLQLAARENSRDAYRRYARHVNEVSGRGVTLRGLLEFRVPPEAEAVPLAEVEPAQEIVKRFCTGAMSLGSLSTEAHETLAVAMNRIGGKSNTGEGGEDPRRYIPLPNGDSRRSAIKQVASGRFGVTIDYLTNADELQIKLAQGAKPGEGGELPGRKVDAYIASIRYATPGVGLISPPPHHDIYSIEDLKQLIFDLKNANPRARVSVKLVSEVGVGTIAAGVAKGFADHIVIAGDTGGTGASPLTSIKHAGLPWELGLAETQQTLVLNDLRSRVVLQTDGGLRTGRDVAIAALLGAEEMGFATAPLIALGCIMMRKCHLNTCPVGIATQDPELRGRFAGQPEHVINFLFLVAEEVREILARFGFRQFTQLIGRTDLLIPTSRPPRSKAGSLDLSRMLEPASHLRPHVGQYCSQSQPNVLDHILDRDLILQAEPALEQQRPVRIEHSIRNTDRAVGTMLSHEVARRFGAVGLPDNTIHVHLNGSAGQSLGAFLAPGITLELEGDANDYVGKGLSGGRIVIYPSRRSTFRAEENILVGNVVLYGAINGRVFLRGRAAERCCVRNSGAMVVVEGMGDHGCEYMTGGRVVILGETGLNFAAGMSGGIAYVWDPRRVLHHRCNLKTVGLEPLDEFDEVESVRRMIVDHAQLTDSSVADELLTNWPRHVADFVKVLPTEYKRVLEAQRQGVVLIDE